MHPEREPAAVCALPKRCEQGLPGVGLALLVLVAAGVGLRLVNIDSKSLWLDEVLSVSFAGPPFRELLDRAPAQELPLPLTIIWAMRQVSLDEGWLRLPFLLAGVATLPLLHAIGRQVHGERVGLAAAALGALAPYLVKWSQEIRFHGLTIFLATLGTWALLELLDSGADRRGLRRALAALSIATLLNLYSNAFACLIAAIHWGAAGGFAIRRPALRRPLLAASTITLIPAVPVLWLLWPLFSGDAGILHEAPPNHYDHEFWKLLYQTLWGFSHRSWPLAIFLALGTGAGALLLSRRGRVLAWITLAMLILPVALISGLDPNHFYDGRYVAYVLPHMLILVAVAMGWIWDRFLARRVLTPKFGFPPVLGPAGVALLLAAPLMIGPLHTELRFEKRDWRSLAARLYPEIRDEDFIFISPPYNDNPLLYYLDRVAPTGGRVRLDPETPRSWYWEFYRRFRERENPRQFSGPGVHLVPIRRAGAVGEKTHLAHRAWLVTTRPDELTPTEMRGFDLVWTVNPRPGWARNSLFLRAGGDPGDGDGRAADCGARGVTDEHDQGIAE